jgi:hypothetical protein
VAPGGDYAVIEGMVHLAGGDFEELGMYSRYGWRHPGPAYFYLQLPFYEGFGGPVGLFVGAVVVNLAAVAAVVLAAWRCGGRLLGAWAAFVLAAFMAALDTALLRDFWTPNVIILLFAAFTVLCAALAAGRLGALPLVVLAGSVLAQTHIGTAGAVGVLGALSLVLYGVVRRADRRPLLDRPEPGRRGLLRALAPVAAAILVGLVVWLPPIIDEATNSPGNLARARSFISEQPVTHSGREVRWNIVEAYSVLPGGVDSFGRSIDSAVDPAEPGTFAWLWTAATLALLLAGAGVGIRRRRWFPAALCVVALAIVPVAYYSLLHVEGPIYAYLILWLTAAGATAWIGIGGALGPELGRIPWRPPRRALVWVAGAVVLALSAWNVRDVVDARPLDEAYGNDRVRETTRIVERDLDERGSRRPLLSVPNDERWGTAAGVAVELLRDGREPAIDPKAWRFGTHLAPTGREDALVILAGPASRPQPDPRLFHIGTAGETFVYAGPAP